MTNISGLLIDPNTLPGDRLKNNAGVARTQLAQTANAPLPILPWQWRTWDTALILPAAAANDDLGNVPGTFGTNVYTLQAGDLKNAGATTRYALTHIAIPEYYDDAQTVTLRLRAGMETTVASSSCTIDAVVYEMGDDGTPSADLCATSAQDMNSLTEANLDFTITATSLVGGDVLECRVAIACNDSGTGTAVTPVLYKATLLFDARG